MRSPNEPNPGKGKSGISRKAKDNSMGKPSTIQTSDASLEHRIQHHKPGEKLEISLHEIHRLTMSEDIKTLMNDGNFKIRVEAGPQGTLAYLADSSTNEFVGSIKDLNKIFAYKSIINKAEKPKASSYFDERELVVYNRLRYDVVSLKEEPIIPVPEVDKPKVKLMLERIDTIRSNLKLFTEKVAETEEELGFKKHLIDCTIKTLGSVLVKDTGKLTSEDGIPLERKKDEKACEISSWVRAKILTRHVQGLKSFRSFFFSPNSQKSITFTIEELRNNDIRGFHRILLTSSTLMVDLLLNQGVIKNLTQDLEEKDYSKERVTMLPPISLANELLMSCNNKTYRPPKFNHMERSLSITNVIRNINQFFLRSLNLEIPGRITDEEYRQFFKSPDAYKRTDLCSIPVIVQIAKEHLQEAEVNRVYNVVTGKDPNGKLIAKLLLRTFGISDGSVTGRTVTELFNAETREEPGDPANSRDILTQEMFPELFGVTEKPSAIELKLLSVREKPPDRIVVRRKRPQRKGSLLTDSSKEVIERMARINPALSEEISRYLEGFLHPGIQSAIANRTAVFYFAQEHVKIAEEDLHETLDAKRST